MDEPFLYDVFVSFASADEGIARPIWQQLTASGLRVFWSDTSLKNQLGERWFESIQAALEGSKHFLLLATPNSMKSEWVKREYEAFYSHCYSSGSRRLIPALAAGSTASILPILIRQLQGVRLDDPEAMKTIIGLLGGVDVEKLKFAVSDLDEENRELQQTVNKYKAEVTALRDELSAAQGKALNAPLSTRTADNINAGGQPMSDRKDRTTINISDFLFDEVRPHHADLTAAPKASPPLGPLAAFKGDFVGNGFNTIFRPNSTASPTVLPNPVPPPPPPHDNVLELNLTSETLSFSKALGNIPNRGSGNQPDAFLNGVPYVQSINDITIHGQSVGIHFEPGIWIHVPKTTIPDLDRTVSRMASIPHGTTIEAQGLVKDATPGKPQIDPVDITPIINATKAKFKFPSQLATNANTLRIPQDLGPYIALGTITQAMLDDPNSLLRAHISKQTISSTTTLFISTAPPPPQGLFGGGTDNIAFLLGQANAAQPNAQSTQMTAVFWIETVQEKLLVPPLNVGQQFAAKAKPSVPGQRVPTIAGIVPFDIHVPREIVVAFTQIQYTQTVLLNFNGLTWPHVSVNTLVPADDVPIPPEAWGKP